MYIIMAFIMLMKQIPKNSRMTKKWILLLIVWASINIGAKSKYQLDQASVQSVRVRYPSVSVYDVVEVLLQLSI